ncbi:MAG: hypothetical protein JWO98_4719 [Frankiales bacterium]|nr:hypothetical protein [Frankiales bacterium]
MTPCVVHSKPVDADHGYLCTGHFTYLSTMLRDIEDQAAIVTLAPSMAQRTGSGGGSLASERAPLRLTALAFLDPQTRRWVPDFDAKPGLPAPKAIGPWCLFCDHETCAAWRAGRQRDDHDDEQDAGSERLMSILGVLNGWARVVREERGLTSPDRATVTSERDTLSRHLDWLAEQPFIDEMYAEIRDLAESLKALNHTQDEKPAGTCFLLTDGVNVCGGRIWRRDAPRVVWRVSADRCTQEPVSIADGPAYCERCNTEWDGADLDRLNLILEQQHAELARPKTEDGRKMLTAQEMADKLGVSITAFRMRASRQGVRGPDGYYDPDVFRRQMSA